MLICKLGAGELVVKLHSRANHDLTVAVLPPALLVVELLEVGPEFAVRREGISNKVALLGVARAAKKMQW